MRESVRVKTVYEKPIAEVVIFSKSDIVTTSGPTDGNQGDWDPQSYARYPIY